MGTETLARGGDAGIEVPSPTAGAGASRVGYEPALDGLRAVAVFAVLVYHEHGPASDKLGRGGFLGVDLFFVLSGYLITTLIVRERASTGGIALASFWRRRARRLLPALFVAIGLGVLYAHLYASASERREIKDGILPALFYFENWHAFSHVASVLAPTWSLAIEEQWYLVWPVVLWLVLRRQARPNRVLIGAIASLAAISAVWTWHVANPPYTHAYYGTDTRGQSLLVGASLALALTRVARPTRARAIAAIDFAAVAGLAFVAFAFVDWRARGWPTFHGGISLVALAGAALILAATQPGSRVRRALAVRPLVAIGLISYGVYLYSLPLSFVLSAKRTHTSGSVLFVVRVVAALVCAYLSWRFIEQPIRRAPESRRWPWLAIAAGLVLCLAAFATLQAPSRAALRRNRSGGLQGFLRQYGVLALDAPAGSTRLLVVGGDSAGVLDGLAHPYRGAAVYGVAAPIKTCGVTTSLSPAPVGRVSNPCAFTQSFLVGIADAYRPTDVAIMIEATDSSGRDVGGRTVTAGSAAWARDATQQLDEFRTRLPSVARHVVLVGGCGPPSRLGRDTTARADRVWSQYARSHAPQVRTVVAPPSVCSGHVPTPAMWPWLARVVAE